MAQPFDSWAPPDPEDEKAIRRIKAPYIGGGPPRDRLPGISSSYDLVQAQKLYGHSIANAQKKSATWYHEYGDKLGSRIFERSVTRFPSYNKQFAGDPAAGTDGSAGGLFRAQTAPGPSFGRAAYDTGIKREDHSGVDP